MLGLAEQSREQEPCVFLPTSVLAHQRLLRSSCTRERAKGTESGSKETSTNNQFIFNPQQDFCSPRQTPAAPAHCQVTRVKLNPLREWPRGLLAVRRSLADRLTFSRLSQ